MCEITAGNLLSPGLVEFKKNKLVYQFSLAITDYCTAKHAAFARTLLEITVNNFRL